MEIQNKVKLTVEFIRKDIIKNPKIDRIHLYFKKLDESLLILNQKLKQNPKLISKLDPNLISKLNSGECQLKQGDHLLYDIFLDLPQEGDEGTLQFFCKETINKNLFITNQRACLELTAKKLHNLTIKAAVLNYCSDPYNRTSTGMRCIRQDIPVKCSFPENIKDGQEYRLVIEQTGMIAEAKIIRNITSFINEHYNVIKKSHDIDDLSKIKEFYLCESHSIPGHRLVHAKFIDTFSNQNIGVLVENKSASKLLNRDLSEQTVWLNSTPNIWGWDLNKKDKDLVRDDVFDVTDFKKKYWESLILSTKIENKINSLIREIMSNNNKESKLKLYKKIKICSEGLDYLNVMIKLQSHRSELDNISSRKIARMLFQARTKSMVNALKEKSIECNKLFVIAGMAHFIETTDPSMLPDCSLTTFQNYLDEGNKKFAILFPKRDAVKEIEKQVLTVCKETFNEIHKDYNSSKEGTDDDLLQELERDHLEIDNSSEDEVDDNHSDKNELILTYARIFGINEDLIKKGLDDEDSPEYQKVEELFDLIEKKMEFNEKTSAQNYFEKLLSDELSSEEFIEKIMKKLNINKN